ncbi:hypothetical protein [Corynebacterium comes]|uniref:Uncharacterized protein n=1 Tax=Corynebacterium comes TaxID=2675218 RepID=A0A6B8VM53_9CORY|nr:hypothetical protein [Corynebacterium comes]QGU05123.1 hypothetical protein CETAM_09360 [Corynebacterium comes]
MRFEDYVTADYTRAVKADHRLQALETTVKFMVGQCYGCAWSEVIKPLAESLVGFSRNIPVQAKEYSDDIFDFASHVVTGEEIMRREFPEAVEAENGTEEWLRTMEAYDAVTAVWLKFLEDADAAEGCMLRIPKPVYTPSNWSIL